jgi:curved DNA-binding protein
MQFRDYYATLEVPRTATADEIKKSYRRLSKKYHPDVNVGDKGAEEKFKALGEAYEVLKDPEKRQRYDRLGANWKQGQGFDPGAGFGGFGGGNPFGGGAWQNVEWSTGGFGGGGAQPPSGFSDFFDAFFAQQQGGPQAGRGRGQRRRGGPSPFEPRQGADREAELTITLEEALSGGSRSMTLQHAVTGPDGGRRLEEKGYTVKIPKEARDGLKIRLKGEGERGLGGGPAGDLLLTLRLQPHPRFTVVDGADLVARLAVAPWEAAAGAKVSFATLDGEVKLTVPPATTSGSKLRLKGKGLPKKDGERGNLTVEIVVAMPPELSAEEKALLERWQGLRPGWSPRG